MSTPASAPVPETALGSFEHYLSLWVLSCIVLFIAHWFRPWLPAAQIDSYIAGLILLAAAPCTAMVFVWSQLCRGEPHFTLSQVALNDMIMVLLYIVVPVLLAQALRRQALRRARLYAQLAVFKPVSLLALLATLVLLFGFQGRKILAQPLAG